MSRPSSNDHFDTCEHGVSYDDECAACEPSSDLGPSGRCEDAPCCGCCGAGSGGHGDYLAREEQPEPLDYYDFPDDGRWDDDPSVYDGTYSEM